MAAPHCVVGRFQPDFMTLLVKALKAPRFEGSLSQFLPEIGVFPIKRFITEHAMLTTFYFIEPIAHGVEKIAVGVDDDAVWLKLDDRKGAVQRFEYRFLRHEQVMLQGHVGGDFNDFADLAIWLTGK